VQCCVLSCFLPSNRLAGQVSLHTHSRSHTSSISGNSLAILAAEVEILVSLASELFSEQGHPGKLSKYMDTSNLGWIHQVHKKQTVQPSSQVEQTKALLTSKLCERPVGGNLLELSLSLEGSTRLGRSRALLRPRLCAPCTVSGWRKTPPPPTSFPGSKCC
jgi:hypothetical protein